MCIHLEVMGQAGSAADGKVQWKGQLVQLIMQSLLSLD